MKRAIFLIAALSLLTIGCKKETIQKSSQVTSRTGTDSIENLSTTAASALKGVNWACTGDNFADTILVLSGLTSTDSYTTVSSKTDAILSGIITNTGANTIRIPINYQTVSQSWWNSYMAVIDKATNKGMNVILGCWEGKSSEDGMIDNTTQFWSMWQTVVNKYGSNSHVYFEIFNEPHGYSLSAWTTICAQWLSNYPSVPHGRILIDGTSYAQDVKGVGADSRFTGCLLSIHDYTFFSNGTLTTAAQWESRLVGNVGSYGSRTVLTEFGDTMNSGINNTGAIGGSQDIAYIQGLTNEVRTLGMGIVYWPGIRNGDGYAIEVLGGSSSSPTVFTTNSSGLSRIKYGWGVGTGGTDLFYTGAYYRLINQNSALAMDVNGASLANGANIIQWPQNGGNNQQWVITDNGSGYYKIVNRNSGLALDVNGGSTTSGATIIQWPWNSGNNQQWQLTSVSTGVYKVIDRNSGLVVDVSGASKSNGANLIQSPWNGGANQQWQIVQQ
ncbi:MAG: RICIN domain-containing protein [Mucilaginibacter sp.]